jgi:menaquinone-dependent protoporphyrinogen oxidase
MLIGAFKKPKFSIMKQKHSRREFLLTSSKSLLGTIVLLNLWQQLAFSQTNKIPEIKTSKTSTTEKQNNKILVVYDSKFGSTAEIAEFIGKHLPTSNQIIDIKPIDEVQNLSPYNNVIIGSAIQYNKWLPAARDFIVIHENELSIKNVSFFLVCLTLARDNEKSSKEADTYAKEIESLVPNVKVQHFGKFAGVLDYSKMSFAQRILAKGIFLILGIKEGDYRDWNEIENWTKRLYLTQ